MSDIKRKVLAIDDDNINLEILKILLQKMDLDPLIEESSERALKRVLQEPPDIILLDIMMTNIDGFEVCRRLKADRRTADIPIIFISAKNDPSDIAYGLELGAADYIVKPIQFIELKARIGTVCRMLDLQEKLISQANTDKLTGIANRTLLLDRLGVVIERAKRQKSCLFAILYLDLDKFKNTNDSLGHHYGDQLLIEVSKKLNACVRSEDTVARMGGDEFAILLDGINDFSEAITITERIQHALRQPMHLDDNVVTVSSSMGIVVSASGQVTQEVILRNADTAMYRAKEMGKDCYQLFDPIMQEQVQQRLDLKISLQRAIDQEEFVLHYQPIVELQTGTLKGFEALIRWQDPDRGWVSPLDFIPLCEETGLIMPIGQWVLEQACRQLSLWNEKFPLPNPLSINVNISIKQLSSNDIIEQISSILKRSQLDPCCLNLEITESMLMNYPDLITSTLDKIKALSVGLSLDDFGTGFSSLSYLHQLPVDNLKVDRSFIERITTDKNGAKMVQTIVWLTQHLGLTTVAEGIETPEQLAYLKDIGCQYGQGYYFSKPLNHEDAEQLIAQNDKLTVESQASS